MPRFSNSLIDSLASSSYCTLAEYKVPSKNSKRGKADRDPLHLPAQSIDWPRERKGGSGCGGYRERAHHLLPAKSS